MSILFRKLCEFIGAFVIVVCFIAAVVAMLSILSGCSGEQIRHSPARPHVYNKSTSLPRKPPSYIRCDRDGTCYRYRLDGQRVYQ